MGRIRSSKDVLIGEGPSTIMLTCLRFFVVPVQGDGDIAWRLVHVSYCGGAVPSVHEWDFHIFPLDSTGTCVEGKGGRRTSLGEKIDLF